MKIQKLITKTESYLNADERKRKEKRKYLKRVLKKLKKHEKSLIELLETESNPTTRAKIEKELALTHAHRKKGLKNLKALKKEQKPKKK